MRYPGSMGELASWFASDDDCPDYLERVRWPRSFGSTHSVGMMQAGVAAWSLQVRDLRCSDGGGSGHQRSFAGYAGDGLVDTPVAWQAAFSFVKLGFGET